MPKFNPLPLKIPPKTGDIKLDNYIKELSRSLYQLWNVVKIREFLPKIKSINYTAFDGDFVEARNGVTIKLDDKAKYNDQMIIANGDGTPITLDGQTIDIKYLTTSKTLIMNNQGTSFHLHLFVEGSTKYWRAR